MKKILLLLIIFSYLPIIFFQSYVEPDSTLFWGSFIGMSGIVTLTWQIILGVRGLVSRLISDLFWINKIHKFLGIFGISILLTHPFLMFVFYISNDINLFQLRPFGNEMDNYLFFGKIAFGFLSLNWFISVFLRKRLTFRWWKKLHFIGYVVLPLSLIHSYNNGTNLFLSKELQLYWQFISAVFILILIYRILFRLGLFRKKYLVSSVENITKDTIKINLLPKGKFIKPKNGQFIYLQRNLKSETHPFTVSHFDRQTGMLSITTKALGKFTSELQNIKNQEQVYIDGPYGVFAQNIEGFDNIVLVAGGIGITPFLWIMKEIENGFQGKVTLFYGNKNSNDIAFASYLEELERRFINFKLVNVISAQENYTGEKGYITAELISKYLGDMFSKSTFFISGPPALIESTLNQLKNSGIERDKVNFELFSL